MSWLAVWCRAMWVLVSWRSATTVALSHLVAVLSSAGRMAKSTQPWPCTKAPSLPESLLALV